MASPFFIGRKEELSRLDLLFEKRSASLVVIKGRRRIGKSRLIEEFAKDKRFLRFSGIPVTTDVTDQKQRDIFAQQMVKQTSGPTLKAGDWSELFSYLASQIKNDPTVILFDEISWMGSKDPTFLGKLKNAWDIEFKENTNLVLVLCGSVSTWIQENIIKSTAFFGRVSLTLHLEELDLTDCSTFLDERGFRGSAYEKFKILSVLGGIPWYLEQVQPKLNADENITHLCFRKGGVLVNEFDLIFHDLFTQRNETYKRIIDSLARGSFEFNQIADEIRYSKGGVLSEYLDNLIEAGFITRNFTWSFKTGRESPRLSHYRLSDNYLRFYLRYIAPQLSKISRDEFRLVSPSSFPGWDSMMGLQFENLVLKNRHKIKNYLRIRPEDIIIDNPYFQRQTATHPGFQVDYLIQTRYNVLFFCEVKFSRQEIKAGILTEMKTKISKATLPRGMACCPVLICINGVEDSVLDSQYFTDIIDFSMFLEHE
jgi:uncharacterized protein